jgi:hypothetical protein
MSMLFDGLLDSVCADALFNSEGTVDRVTTDMAIIEIFIVGQILRSVAFRYQDAQNKRIRIL